MGGTATCLTTKAGSRPTDNFLLRSIPDAVALANVNPSGNGMNGAIFDESFVSPTLTTNKGEGIKIAGHLNMKGAYQLKRIYETGGVSPTLTTMQGGHQEPKIIQRIAPSPIMIDNYNRSTITNGISPTLTTNCGTASKGNGLSVLLPMIAASRGRNRDNPSDRTPGNKATQRLEINTQGTSNALTTVQKDNYVLLPNVKTKNEKPNRGVLFLQNTWWWVRKLTPRECLRLQDFPDSFKIVVSNSQAYKQAGNSMSVNVLEMIFRQIEKAKAGVAPVGRLF